MEHDAVVGGSVAATSTAPAGKLARSSSWRMMKTGPAATPKQAALPWSIKTGWRSSLAGGSFGLALRSCNVKGGIAGGVPFPPYPRQIQYPGGVLPTLRVVVL